VKEGESDGPHEVDMITGATISAEAVIEIINERLEALGPALAEFRSVEAGPGGRQAAATDGSGAGEGGR
jgi:hypothetical protein